MYVCNCIANKCLEKLLQEFPTGFPKLEQDIEPWQVWHETGLRCPAGTIPIRRDLSHAAFHSKSHPTMQSMVSTGPIPPADIRYFENVNYSFYFTINNISS